MNEYYHVLVHVEFGGTSSTIVLVQFDKSRGCKDQTVVCMMRSWMNLLITHNNSESDLPPLHENRV